MVTNFIPGSITRRSPKIQVFPNPLHPWRVLALRFRSVAKIAKDARHLFIQHPVRRLHPGRIRVGFVCDIRLGFSTQFSVHIIGRSHARAAACHGGCCWGLVEKMAKGAQFVLHLITHFLLELGGCPSSWGAPSPVEGLSVQLRAPLGQADYPR